MLRVVRRLFHAMFATPAAPVAADVSAASLFFKDLEERQQRRGLLRCLHAVCGTTADKCGHLPELRAHAVTKSRSHTGERESAVDRQARISDELVTGCVACTDSVLLEVIRNASQYTAESFDVAAFSELVEGVDHNRSALLVSKKIWDHIVTRHTSFYDIYSESDRPDMHQHFGYLDGIHVISDAFMLTGLQTLARAGAIAVLVPFPVSLDIHTAYTESGNGSGYCEYEAECSVSVRLDPKSCRVFRLKYK